MSLRIAREEYYFPLPMDSEQVWMLRGSTECFMPLEETFILDWVLRELSELGSRGSAPGLIIEDNSMYLQNAEVKESEHRVAYSVRCGIAKKDGVSYLHLSHIEPVSFGLYWIDGKCCQREGGDGEGLNKPTAGQMAAVASVAQTVLSQHKIPSAKTSQINPYLFALIIPTSFGEAVVKAFANDLFHALNILPREETMDIAEATHYCALDVDKAKGVYLVIFNHPSIFDYAEDSPERHCAYGEWNQ